MPFALSSLPLPGHAVFVPGLQGPGGRRSGVFRAVWGLRSLRGVGSLRAFVLDSSVVPSWVVAQAQWLSRDRLLSGGDLKSGPSGRLGRKRPRAPRKRGACAAVKTAALPKE